MADIASSDVVYTVQKQRLGESGVKQNQVLVAFGNGALTYPAGGVPLLKASLGVPNAIESLIVFGPGSADGYIYKYDHANAKIRIYIGDSDGVADGPAVELGNVAVAAASLYCEVKGY